ncbi:hypothetical protein MTR67_008908 [Solanum verrucosum]|uniref:FAD-binding PCMH-type domain-containing protein n=1 Tax=Solanum verrucosum TaxID=315347 RepID=A0AAF0Q2X9_SOLVR|nr:hypothetical protein MTR67_008908 [Solanum verrucosum]
MNSISQVIHTPKNSSYSTILNSFSDNLRITSDFKPSIIFAHTNKSQIQVGIHCSKIHDLQIRIRSGGHDYEGLSHISETHFFIIDLRFLRSISIDTQKKTACIQAGATLGDAYYRIAQKSKNLAVVAGVCPTVGVGGHFSGGGYGMMSRKFGTAADNIIDAKLIDANGRIKDRESMVNIPEKVTVFNVTRRLEHNVTQLVYKWQHIADKVDDNLLLRIFLKSNIESPFRRGQRTVHAFFTTMFVGGVDKLLREMQKRYPELGILGEMENSKRNIAWNRKLYRYMAKYVSKSPRAAYFNYRDLDVGMNNINGNTSYEQARIWGVKYFKNNSDRLVKVKTNIDPTNFFRNEQKISIIKGSSSPRWISYSIRYLPTQVLREFRCELGITVEDHSYLVDSLEGLSNLGIRLKVFVHASRDNLRITSDFKPSIIFTPTNESQIQVAIHCSKIHDRQIRIRSGGHDYEGLSHISETPFFIIDLRNLRSISIDTQKKTAWIQAGATLGEVYYRIAQKSKNLAVVGGVCPTVGVGGYFSGGGYGMMSRKFGTAADYIIDAKLIDANGRIKDRESMGEDHFWAIRGGGGTSFGLIISWKVKLVDIPEKVTVFNVTRRLEQNVTQLVYKWQHIADKVDDNLLLRIFLKSNIESPFRRGQRTVHAFFTTMFVGGVDKLLREMQKSFPELGTTNQEYYFKGKSDYVQHPISINGLEGIWKLYTQLGENSGVELQFSPYGGKLSEISESETPFPHRAGNIFMIEYSVFWVKMENSKRNIAWNQKLYRYMAKYVSKSPRAAYFNYRDLDLGVNNIIGNTSYEQARIWGVKYFKNNFDRLVNVKTKIDPTNFFRNEQSIPPLFAKVGLSKIASSALFLKDKFVSLCYVRR